MLVLLIAVTPKGVEHTPFRTIATGDYGLLIAVTPKGVEHVRELAKNPRGLILLIAVTPKGVEHFSAVNNQRLYFAC